MTFASGQNSQMNFEKNLPDSIKYVLPEFGQGRLVYTDGGFSTGRFNISTIDQSLRYIDEKGEVMSVTDNGNIDRVTINGMLFIKHQSSYVGIVQQYDDIYLCASRKMEFKTNVNAGYGKASGTTAISTVNKITTDVGQTFDYTQADDYSIKLQPFILRNNRLYAPSKSSILKSFPDKADQIKAYLGDHDVNFNDFDAVKQMLDSLE